MASRRSLRSASRQLSSRDATPVPTDAGTTPSRSNRRAGNVELPAVSLRSSTAYGTNSVPQLTGRRVQHNQQLDDVLKTVLTPTDDGASTTTTARRRGRRGTASTANPDKSYNTEDAVFRGTQFDTSSVSQVSDRGAQNIPEESDSEDDSISNQYQSQRPSGSRHNPENVLDSSNIQPTQDQPSVGSSPLADWLFSILDFVINTTFNIKDSAILVFSKLSSRWGLLIALLGILFVFGNFQTPTDDLFVDDPSTSYDGSGRSYDWTLPSLSVPRWVKHPLNSFAGKFSPDVVQDLSSLLYTTREDIEVIKGHTKVNAKAIQKLEKALPDFLVVKKDRRGDLQIPQDLWHALRDLIRSDPELVSEPSNPYPSQPSSKSTEMSIKDFEKQAAKTWNKFLEQNQAKIKSWSDAELEEKFPDYLKSNSVVTRAQVLEMVRQSWDDHSKDVKDELATILKNVERQQRQLAKLQDSPIGQTKQQLRTIVAQLIQEILPAAQLEALSKANIRTGAKSDLTQLNHWSHGTGAIIDPHHTSANYQFPSMNHWFPTKAFRYAVRNPVPIPNPPEAAFTKWDEHGDCWCTAAKGDDGNGASLGVISGAGVSPEQVVVEHIAPGASLQPGAAPREMELWAYIEDFNTYDAVKQLSQEMFSGDVRTQETLGYVRIATWTYDLEGDVVQSFPVQLGLKGFGVGSDKTIIRMKSNYGADYTCLYRVKVYGEIVPR